MVKKAKCGKCSNTLDYLLYHFVESPGDNKFSQGKPGWNYLICRQRFRKELDYLHANFNSVSLREVKRWQTEPKYLLPPRPIVITFDGANAEWLNVVAPELEKRNMKAVFFTVTGWVEKHEYEHVKAIGWRGLRKLASIKGSDGKKLFEIESHSVDHCLIKSIYSVKDDIVFQLRNSKKTLDYHLNQNTEFFALPDGNFSGNDVISKEIKLIAAQEGYFGIRTSKETSPVNKASDPMSQTCRYIARRNGTVFSLIHILGTPYRSPISNIIMKSVSKIITIYPLCQ